MRETKAEEVELELEYDTEKVLGVLACFGQAPIYYTEEEILAYTESDIRDELNLLEAFNYLREDKDGYRIPEFREKVRDDAQELHGLVRKNYWGHAGEFMREADAKLESINQSLESIDF